jgi:hypothetical protein
MQNPSASRASLDASLGCEDFLHFSEESIAPDRAFREFSGNLLTRDFGHLVER